MFKTAFPLLVLGFTLTCIAGDEVEKQPPSEEEVRAVYLKLKTKDSGEAVKSLEEDPQLKLAVCRQLCEKLVEATDSKSREACLELLEKCEPDHFEAAKAAFLDGSVKNRIDSIETLGIWKSSSMYALPIIHERLDRSLKNRRDFNINEPIQCINSICVIDPKSKETADLLLKLARSSEVMTSPLGKTVVYHMAKCEGIERKKIVSELLRLYKSSNTPLVRNAGYDTRITKVELMSTIKEFGADAEEALPLFKKEKNSSISEVRSSANEAIEEIEDAIADAKKGDA